MAKKLGLETWDPMWTHYYHKRCSEVDINHIMGAHFHHAKLAEAPYGEEFIVVTPHSGPPVSIHPCYIHSFIHPSIHISKKHPCFIHLSKIHPSIHLKHIHVSFIHSLIHPLMGSSTLAYCALMYLYHHLWKCKLIKILCSFCVASTKLQWMSVEILGIIGQHSSVSESNALHVWIFSFFFTNLM